MTLPRSATAALATILVALIFGPPPAAASKIKQVDYTCPIGGAKFTQRTVFSGSVQGRRLDTRPYGRIVSPFPLPVCKSNGFVMYQDTFTDAELARLTPLVKDKAYQALRKKHYSYYLAAHLRERMGSVSDLELASMYLRASWQAEGSWSPHRAAEDSTKEDRALVEDYRKRALTRLDAVLARDGERSSQWWSAAVLAAELERLLGRFAEAETRLARLLADAGAASAGQRNAMAQIRAEAAAGNASPQALSSEKDDRPAEP